MINLTAFEWRIKVPQQKPIWHSFGSHSHLEIQTSFWCETAIQKGAVVGVVQTNIEFWRKILSEKWKIDVAYCLHFWTRHKRFIILWWQGHQEKFLSINYITNILYPTIRNVTYIIRRTYKKSSVPFTFLHMSSVLRSTWEKFKRSRKMR